MPVPDTCGGRFRLLGFSSWPVCQNLGLSNEFVVSKENVGAKISVLGFTSQFFATIFHFLSMSLGKGSSPLYVQEEVDAIVDAACRPSRTAETVPPGRNGFMRKSVPATGTAPAYRGYL